MRKHEYTIKEKKWYGEVERQVSFINRGLKRVHIGNSVWLIGKQSLVENPDKTDTNNGSGDTVVHSVIYAPDGKEHHVYGKVLTNLCMLKATDSKHMEFSPVNRHGNRAIEGQVKIYILTNILDDVKNWCFDLTKIPNNGQLKVIYDNGTVKNIEFTGEFVQTSLGKRYASGYKSNNKTVTPVGYRKN